MRGGAFGARARAGRGVFRTPDEDVDRSLLDRTEGRNIWHRVSGTGNIDVTVKSRGQQSVSQPGPFRKVRIQRLTQMLRERARGVKTEPAFAAVLKLKGDPYLAILDLERCDDTRLSDLLVRAGF